MGDAKASDVDRVSWEHDDETGGLVHMLAITDGVQVGLWKPDGRADATIEVHLEFDETILVLAGQGRVEVDGGEPIGLRPGVIVSLPKGARTRWTVDQAFRELWIYS